MGQMPSHEENLTFVEALEPRIAPASFSFVDVDGDDVTITTSKGTTDDIQSAAHLQANGLGFILESLNLGSNAVFSGNSVSIVAKRTSFEGDGLVNVGFIDGGSLNFGKVTVDGDLGKIMAGGGVAKTNAIFTFSVFSLGAKGTSTGAADLMSSLAGSVGEIDVATNIDTATLLFSVSGSKLGKLIVGGDIIGGSTLQQGGVSIDGAVSSISVGGSLIGGDGNQSGEITATSIGSLVIKNSVNGGNGIDSGSIQVSDAASSTSSLRIGQNITGGLGIDSGRIHHEGTIKSLTLTGSLIGGDGTDSGQVVAQMITTLENSQSISGKGGDHSGTYLVGTLGTAKVGGDIFGGTGADSGGISATTGIKTLTLKGSLFGTGTSGSGFISTDATAQIGTLTIRGNLFGGGGDDSGTIDVGLLSKAVISGSLFGSSGDRSGSILLTQGYDSLSIGQNLSGGAGDYSGSIHFLDPLSLRATTLEIGGHLSGSSGIGSGSVIGDGTITGGKTITIDGAIEGGQGTDSGLVKLLGTFSTVNLGGLLHGGQGENSGSVHLGGATKISVIGDIRGGLNASNSGLLSVDGAVKTLALSGSIVGGTNQSAFAMTNSGAILIGGNLGTLTLSGSFLAGNANTSDDLNLGAIRAGGTITSLTIEGSIQGNSTMSAMITAKGLPSPTTKNLAIGTLTVDGDVTQAEILAGYDIIGTGIDGDGGASGGSAQIGTVKVGGDWNASSLVAGAMTGVSHEWGTSSNALLTKPSATLVASIAKIIINGAIEGLPGAQSGFVAEQFLSFVTEGETLVIPNEPFLQQIGALSTQTIVVVKA